MTTGFFVPKKHSNALRDFQALPRPVRGQLAAVLDQIPLRLDAIASILGGDRARAEQMVEMLSSLYATRIDQDFSSEATADRVRQAAEESPESKKSPLSGTWDEFAKDLCSILSLDKSFGAVVKAEALTSEYEQVVRRVRVLTDLRPIFHDDANAPPVAYLIDHTLRIEYGTLEGPKEFFIAFSTADLKQLRSSVERALQKESAARRQLLSWGAVIIDPSSET